MGTHIDHLNMYNKKKKNSEYKQMAHEMLIFL